MTYTIAKIIFWLMLCVPMLALGIFLLSRLQGDILDVYKAMQAKKDRREAERLKRMQFEEEYRQRHGGGF